MWLRSEDRSAVTIAAHAIDRELRDDAPLKGSELSEGLRSLYSPPLKAMFSVRG